MSHVARSVYAASVYVIGLGIGLILIPDVVLGLFGMPPTQEVWIRMLGMMSVFVGLFQLQGARAELRSFFHLSVILRLSVLGFVLAFIITGLAAPIFILVATVDVLGAGWTWFELQREKTNSLTLLSR